MRRRRRSQGEPLRRPKLSLATFTTELAKGLVRKGLKGELDDIEAWPDGVNENDKQFDKQFDDL